MTSTTSTTTTTEEYNSTIYIYIREDVLRESIQTNARYMCLCVIVRQYYYCNHEFYVFLNDDCNQVFKANEAKHTSFNRII